MEKRIFPDESSSSFTQWGSCGADLGNNFFTVYTKLPAESVNLRNPRVPSSLCCLDTKRSNGIWKSAVDLNSSNGIAELSSIKHKNLMEYKCFQKGFNSGGGCCRDSGVAGDDSGGRKSCVEFAAQVLDCCL